MAHSYSRQYSNPASSSSTRNDFTLNESLLVDMDGSTPSSITTDLHTVFSPQGHSRGDFDFDAESVESVDAPRSPIRNHISWMNSWLSTGPSSGRRDGNKRSFFFCFMSTVAVANGVFFLFGTFMSPSVYEAISHQNDPLLAVTLVCWSAGICIAVPGLDVFRRQIIPNGSLPQLIALIDVSIDKHKRLRKTVTMMCIVSGSFWLLSLLGFGYIVVTGAGFHSPWYNRLSALLQLVTWLYAVPLACAAFISITTATLCAQQATVAVIHSLKTRPTPDEWDRKALRPTVTLAIQIMPLVSQFSSLIMLCFGVFWILAFSFFALSINPNMEYIQTRVGLEWLPTAALTMLSFFTTATTAFVPLLLAREPASVSTSCKDLVNELNNIRLAEPIVETDLRVGILERAISKANHGQGIGFFFGRTLIDQAFLQKIGTTIGALVSTIVPIVWAWRLSARQDTSIEFCHLSTAQQGAWQVFAAQFNDTCTYNLTVGPNGVNIYS